MPLRFQAYIFSSCCDRLLSAQSVHLVDGGPLLTKEQLRFPIAVDVGQVCISSFYRPTVALRYPLFQLYSGVTAATFLERTFYDLHWVGLTPDRIVRYIPKRLFFRTFDYKTRYQKGSGLALLGVEMNFADIEASLKDLSEKWRQEQEARFGA